MNSVNRRNFFSKVALGVLGVVVAPRVLAEGCKATPKPEGKKVVDPTDATGKRIEYYAVASEGKGNKLFTEGSNCANCRFYNEKRGANGWAPCTMAANQFVSACGWCKLYKAKA